MSRWICQYWIKVVERMIKVLHYIFVVIMLTALGGCGVGKGLTSDKHKEVLTEKQEMEYLFHFIEGNKLKTLGYFNDAVANYNKCLVLKPQSDAVNYELANVYILNNDFYKALSYSKIAANKDRTNVWYQLLYANLLIQNKDFKEAVSTLESYLKRDAENMEVKLLLASIYSSSGKDAKKAIAIYESIENNMGFSEELAFEKEKLFSRMGESEKALEEIRRLTILDPENPRYYGLYAESLINSGKYTEAEEVYRTLFLLDPENGLAHLSFGEYLLNKGKKIEALEELRKGMSSESLSVKSKGNMIIKLETTYKESISRAQMIEFIKIINRIHPKSIQGHAMLADYYMEDRNFSQAREELLIILEKQKEVSRVWDQLLALDYELLDYTSLYNHSKDAIELFPSYNKFYLMHAFACERLKKYQEGADMLEMGIDFVVDDNELKSEFYAQLAENYNRLDKHESSDAAFDNALEQNPKNVLVLNNYSYYLSLRKEKLDIAIRHIELANIISPDNKTYLDTYAWVLFQMEKYEEALVKIENAIKYGGDKSAVIVDHYGDILYKLNKNNQAIIQWKRAKEMGLNSVELDLKIEKGKIEE
jgi:tetratricopeptide (TPR) repeat protein